VTFATSDLTANIGTEIRSDIQTLLDGTHAARIRALLEERGVIVLPGIGLSDEQQLAFTKTIGTVVQEEHYDKAVFKISLDPRETERSESLKASFFWHIDGTTADVPIFASLLSAVRLSPVGGDTEFCNTHASYEALPDEERAWLDTLVVHHSAVAIARHCDPELDYDRYQRLRARGADLPLVWRHRDGRRSLVIGASAEYVVGMPGRDSADLLIRLRDWATQPRFVYRHSWSVGDLLMWDNTGTMHRATPYAADSGRLMLRTRLAGEESFNAAALGAFA
jgi:alpha-ketoglutarate-dependent taurine dioxygenase